LQECSGGMAAALRCRQSVIFSRADLLPYIRASVGVRFGVALLVITAKAIKYFRA